MLETQEPIVHQEPILGLGEDYEPDTVWTSKKKRWTESELPDAPAGFGVCFVTKQAADAACGADRTYTVPETSRMARERGLVGVAVLDADLSVVESWLV